MFELKRISAEAIPEALEKALRYRLLNEPLQAESICRDVLAVEPDNQQALVTLLLAVTDQFEKDFGTDRDRATEILPQLEGDYERLYYEGIIHERWAKSRLARGMRPETAVGWFREAMRCYEKADEIRTADDPDAALRWNTCARFLQRLPPSEHVGQSLTKDVEAEFGDDMPQR